MDGNQVHNHVYVHVMIHDMYIQNMIILDSIISRKLQGAEIRAAVELTLLLSVTANVTVCAW